MAYIGREPTVGNFQVCDAISVVNGQAAYTMQVGSVNVSPETANHMLVSLNGVLQAPGSSFSVSGSTITFASNLVTGDVINFIHILGSVLDLGVPSDSTVSLAKLTATGTKSSSTFLRGDNTFATVVSGLTEADAYRLVADVSGDATPVATSNLQRVDDATFSKIGTGVSYNTSNGRFTFGATGLYFVEITAVFIIDASADYNVDFTLQGTANDFTASDDLCGCNFGGDGNVERNTNTNSTLFNCTNTSTHKVRLSFSGTSSNNLQGTSGVTKTGIRFIRLGDSQ